jgi:hypothetical protein
VNRGPHHHLTEQGVLEQLESGLIALLNIVGDWYTTSPASHIPALICTHVCTVFLEDSEWNQAVMATPSFPTPGEQEVLDSLPIPTDDNIPRIHTPSPLPAVPILLATDQVTPLPRSITANIIESTEEPTGDHPGGYFVEAAKVPNNHPIMAIVDQGHPRSLKYIKYGLVNDEPCVLGTDGKGCDIYHTPLHATP